MKKIILLQSLLFALFTFSTSAQSTTISPGTVLPQVTTAQRTAITSPNGVLVFDSNTQSYWYRQSGVWVELPKGGSTSNYWQLSGLGGNELKNTNSGGFWSANPIGLTSSSSNTTNPPTAPIEGDGTRMMWIPNRSAFRVGTVTPGLKSWDKDSVGLFSFAAGYNTKAKGNYSIALGFQTTASGEVSTAMGYQTTASRTFSTAMGYQTTAGGNYSSAMGHFTTASGDYSTAIGDQTTAIGSSSTAMGNETTAGGQKSTSMGSETTANGDYSTAMGESTTAGGNYSTAMGRETTASGFGSTSIGYLTTASGNYSTAMGSSTIASGFGSTTMGSYTTANGNYSTALGDSTTAGGNYSTAMGEKTTASGEYSTTMGRQTTASGGYATAMGHLTTASGGFSTAMGKEVSTGGFQGGFAIGDSDPLNQGFTTVGIADQFVARFYNGYYLLTSGDGTVASPRTGVSIANGQTAWSAISDSTKKERFVTANGEEFLQKLRGLRLGSWNYKSSNKNPERFYGPMAQELYSAYGKDKYGTIGSDTLVSTLNMDGILFIYAQALENRTKELKAELVESQRKVAELEKYLETNLVQINERMKAIEKAQVLSVGSK